MTPALHPIILAGGSGERLWPLSRRDRPKPFLAPTGGPTLIERAWERALALAPAERIFVATASRLADLVRAQLPELPPSNLILEPEPRDTGPAAVHAAWAVEARSPGAMVALLPADHLMSREPFVAALRAACDVAQSQDGLVCLGIAPSRPSSAFGYVMCEGSAPPHAGSRRVERFVEKPPGTEASELIRGGRALWNAGIFVWRAATFLREAERLSPELSDATRRLREGGDAARFFQEVQPVAVDRAVMERTRSAWVVGAEMGWDDLGGWDAVARHLEPDPDGNLGVGTRVTVGARRCVVEAGSRPVVLVGVEDLVIVECSDVVLVARRAAAGRVREVPARLEEAGLTRLR